MKDRQKDQKICEIIRELSSTFFSRIAGPQSMITVTNVQLLSRGGKAEILITVLPESMEEKALDFANRQLSDFREYVKKNSRIARIPFFEVKIDVGEKNRQRIDEIGKKL